MNRFASLVTLLTLPLLAAALGTAHAQMATTDLVPAAPRVLHPFALGFNSTNIAPENPAAVAWGQPSHVAAGMFDGETEQRLPGPTVTYPVSGNFVGGRFAGPTFGFAIERQSTKQEQTGGSLEDSSAELQASMLLGGIVSLGIGIGDYSRRSLGNDATLNRVQYGASARLGESVYLGAAAFKDKLDASGVIYERTATSYGLALRTKGPWEWYLAFDRIDTPDYTPVAPSDSGFRIDRFTVQVRGGSILFGVSRDSAEVNYTGGGPSDIEATVVDLGWVPMSGFAITLRNSRSDVVDNIAATTDDTVRFNSLNVSWLF